MSNAASEHCKFFVHRKKRYCKMLVKLGQEFCGEHQKPLESGDNETAIRITCPLDRKHTVYAHKLSKHLKICNARQTDPEPFIQKDINAGKSEVPAALASSDSFRMLCTFPKDQITAVIEKVNNIYEKYLKISDKKMSFPLVEAEMAKPEYGDKAKKHFKQASSILGLMKENGLFRDKTCYIEFGAGRGQLSCWIAEATESLEKCQLLLVERASPKHKRDNKLAKTSDRIQRIRADIADLVLDKLNFIEKSQHVVGVTKHLCGAATDLTIRCLTNPEVNKDKIDAAVLTFCCHHRCLWTSYTGKTFLQENDLSIDDFNIICGLSSWATCGSGYSREFREKHKHENYQDNIDMETDEREIIGQRCKNVLNWGRLRYLEANNFKCSLHYYVDKDITLENVCIVALKQVYMGVFMYLYPSADK
ncbi:tRNA:m(4)X modification enzyme TRM13 homolog isoform X2 [Dendroctonus ponderosae]|uniref:tRNA:m(4)X modification enzyme TRM13 homolog isoform X2 n=1 Tax=Dendroctonus ponderosae TaxID=77166 RepID=UPI002035206A|nr:tRNA:m(4)X modification enzyme TRM13 homolog isoform X2 [Dendroctonus ponderosae]